MNNNKLIRNKIESIKSTKKITKTMKMISIAKIKKIKLKLLISQPYLNQIKKIISHFFHIHLKYQSILLTKKKIIKKIGIISILSNKGLCSSLNDNILKETEKKIQKYYSQNIICELYIFGSKGKILTQNNNLNYNFKCIEYTDDIEYTELILLTNQIINKYSYNQLDKVLIISNKYENQFVQKVNFFQLLPLSKNNFFDSKYTQYRYWNYLYEPDSNITINLILKKYILFQLFQLILENILSEHSARMFIMKNATENSEKIIHNLNLLYNKIRQCNITNELIEIISGSSMFL